MNKQNYQAEMESCIARHQAAGQTPTLLLHSCCAPCSSAVLESLSPFFSITVFYYNPNLYPDTEYQTRVAEQKRFITQFPAIHPISFLEGDFEKELFLNRVKGLEHCSEGGERCAICFDLRISKTAETAQQLGMDYFTTTLTISPLKNAALLNEIGQKWAKKVGVSFLPCDFKKKNGYLRSTELSKEYSLYRQDYCGCLFSAEQRRTKPKEINR